MLWNNFSKEEYVKTFHGYPKNGCFPRGYALQWVEGHKKQKTVGTSVLCDSDRFTAMWTVTCIHLSASKHQFVVCCQGSDLSDNTYYIFNHLNIVIEIQRIISDQSDDVPKNAGRIVRAKLIPQRLVRELYYTHTLTPV